MQHLADIIFVQMGNITLLRRDAYLDLLKTGIKPDIWCALRNSPLNFSGLFPDDMVRRAEEEISKTENEHHTTQPGSGHGGYGSRKENRISLIRAIGLVTKKGLDRLLLLQTQTSQLGVPLEGTTTTGVGEEVPPLVAITPRRSKDITKNDNYGANSVQTKVL